MIICVCKRVSDRDIARQAGAGSSFDDIQFELGVGTQCGQCLGCAQEIFEQNACAKHLMFIRKIGVVSEPAV
jgi:bacterioferritin-associated ferredoxin